MSARGTRPKDLGTLDGSRGGLILPRRVKAAFSPTQCAVMPARQFKSSAENPRSSAELDLMDPLLPLS
jgi:hypothetical protein